MCISNKIGPPVEGDDFFGREKEFKKQTNYSIVAILCCCPHPDALASLHWQNV